MCRRADIETKILSNIALQDHGYDTLCHVWQGSHSGSGRGGGYPRMSLDGQTVAVHIVVFTNKNGFVPGKKQIDHKCNNRMCVNPDHLQMVTHKKNQQLRIQRSRKGKDEVVLSKHSKLYSNDSSIHDRGRDCFSEIQGILGYGEEAIETEIDGRYLPDAAYWTNSSDVRFPSLHQASGES